MAKAGLAVPAAAPVLVLPFSMVLADIGDEQSLFANLSTFSGHLRRIQVLQAYIGYYSCNAFISCIRFYLLPYEDIAVYREVERLAVRMRISHLPISYSRHLMGVP